MQFARCTTLFPMPEPDCDNEAEGILFTWEQGELPEYSDQRIVCNVCAQSVITNERFVPVGERRQVAYSSFKALADAQAASAPPYPPRELYRNIRGSSLYGRASQRLGATQ